MTITIHDIIDILHSDPAGVSKKFGIPLPTVYGWCNGNRQPPAYVIGMMYQIVDMERRYGHGNEENRLAEEIRGAGQGEQEARKES